MDREGGDGGRGSMISGTRSFSTFHILCVNRHKGEMVQCLYSLTVCISKPDKSTKMNGARVVDSNEWLVTIGSMSASMPLNTKKRGVEERGR